MWTWEHCRINPSGFLAECRKKLLNQGSFYFAEFYIVCFFELYLVCVFFCSVLFVSISQVIGCEDCLQNDLGCVLQLSNPSVIIEGVITDYLFTMSNNLNTNVTAMGSHGIDKYLQYINFCIKSIHALFLFSYIN